MITQTEEQFRKQLKQMTDTQLDALIALLTVTMDFHLEQSVSFGGLVGVSLPAVLIRIEMENRKLLSVP